MLFALIGFSFLALVWAHVASDFSVVNVFENSHSAKPLLYKISGVWGNHEGSMLLWVLILALFGAAVWLFGANLPLDLRATVLGVQASISAAFIIFIVATSNPFLRIAEAPAEGNGLNPILQDPALAIHPPLLYAGYVGFSMAFSFAIAALILGRVDSAWARWVRPWTLGAWIFLTIGIGVGSWWAYYTLGWGGWWFWDPVENASLMPWLAGTALLHSAIVMEKRDSLKAWTILLAILTFGLSLLGTFLVRSGVITSVHSFASDPARGVFILAIVAAFTAGGFALFAWRASSLAAGSTFSLVSRESALVLNNLLLSVCCGIVLDRHLLPDRARSLHRRQNHRRRAVLQFDRGLDLHAAPAGRALRHIPRLEARRPEGSRPPALACRGGCFRCRRRSGIRGRRRQGRACHTARHMGLRGLGLGSALAREIPVRAAGRNRAPHPRHAPRSVRRDAGPYRARGCGDRRGGGERLGFGETHRAEAGPERGHCRLHHHLQGGVRAARAELRRTRGRFRIAQRRQPHHHHDRLETPLRSAARRQRSRPPSPSGPAATFMSCWATRPRAAAYQIKMYYHPFVRWIWGGSVLMFLAGLLSLLDRRLRIGLPQGARKASLASAPAPAE